MNSDTPAPNQQGFQETSSPSLSICELPRFSGKASIMPATRFSRVGSGADVFHQIMLHWLLA